MPLPTIAYVYLILLIADVICIVFALIKRDWNTLPALVVSLPLFIIGFSCFYQKYFILPFILPRE